MEGDSANTGATSICKPDWRDGDCGICLFPLVNARCVPSCEHTFCEGCLAALRACSKHRHRCPLCRRPLDLSRLDQFKIRDNTNGEPYQWSLEDISVAAADDIDEYAAIKEFLDVFEPADAKPQTRAQEQ